MALALTLASLTPAPAARGQGAGPDETPTASHVRDNAGFFDRAQVERAEQALTAAEKSTGFATYIETAKGLGGEPIEAVAERRATTWGGSGVYVAIDTKARQVRVLITGAARGPLTAGQATAIADVFIAGFRAGDVDGALARGVDAIRAAITAARPGGAAAGPRLVERNRVRLTLEGARLILAGAEAKAAELKLKVNIAVVDDGGHLLAFERMDGARPASGYTALTKATTAATFRQASGPLPKGAEHPDPLLNLSLQNAAAASGGKLTTLFGGVPVEVDDQVIGGVGVGGGTGEQDAQVARAGIARLLEALGAGGAPAEKKPAGGEARGSKAARVIPHHQDAPPNPPRPAAEAASRMTVPPGFTVEVVAAEPDLVNPVAMTFDERGRIWVTESLEYPRRSPGPGRDRVKVLDDTDGDGKADSFTVFADGLNIPSGIAVGHGGVWVANAPDILFLQDTDGDGKADRREVVVRGFGRDDTHELPNTLAWGPDGWLYGWNGVFNPSHIEYRGKTYDFTCAVFRIHPKTRDFELFCEGTSNPWGLAWDREGSAFASACVIDHLWHLTETGYYHRQGGPYPPFTWKIDSIVDHEHQKAAYCGIHFYDSDAYPPAYREKLFMGNIHGNCVNVDRLERRGSTYSAAAEADFLTANDAWFMPVAQKTGPDGSLYVLDWYDRYHCYQDANRDPDGIDRLKGRLYRVRYKETPRRWGFDLAKKSDDELVALLGSPNGYDRETARRLLSERPGDRLDDVLRRVITDPGADRRTRMNALWARVSRSALDPKTSVALLESPDPGMRAWGVRAAGNAHTADADVRARVQDLARDRSPDVQLQVAVAARKLEGVEPIGLLTAVAASCGDDPLIPHVVWQNLHPLLADNAGASRFVAGLDAAQVKGSPALAAILPRAVERLVSRPDPEGVPVERLVTLLVDAGTDACRAAAVDALERVAERVQSGELAGARAAALRERFGPVLGPLLKDAGKGPLPLAAALLATSWHDPNGYPRARAAVASDDLDRSTRLDALDALISAGDREAVALASRILADRAAGRRAFRGQVLSALGRLDDPSVGALVLDCYPRLEPELQPRAVELLTERTGWARDLLKAIGDGVVPADALNVNQVRKLLASKDAALRALVRERWGTVREGRDPRREEVIRDVRALLRKTPGDPIAGARVFERVCGQCHKIYGEGQEVGPELTRNGRASFEQLLSNVFDPSLVIGSAYQGTTVATADGRVLSGLLVERSPERLVLKMQGGKVETIPGDEIEEVKVSATSLMPEDLEKQLRPQEIADLFAFITLDRPPTDPAAKPLPGADVLPRKGGD